MFAGIFFASGCAFTRPIPEVTETSIRGGFVEGWGSYTVWIDCTVRNRGSGSGEVRVVAMLKNGDLRVKEGSTYLSGNNEELKEQQLTFEFLGMGPYSSNLEDLIYSCGAEPTGTPFPDVK